MSALSIADRLDIQDLFARYCFLVDQGKADEWTALFSPDGVFDVPGLAHMVGPAQIRQIAEMVASKSQGKWRHQITNLLAEPDGENGARVTMYSLVTDWSGAGSVGTFNDYTGRLRKIAGQWRIVELVAKPTKITV